LPRRSLHVSTFELENDAIVSPSAFLEDIDGVGLPTELPESVVVERVFVHEALTADPPVTSALDPETARWLAIRTTRSTAELPEFHGTAAEYRPDAYSISSLERYLQCPFKFFAERVLQLQDDPEDEATLNPRELGIFVHEVFQRFFEEWNRSGRRSMTPENLPQAREIFRQVAESALSGLPEDQAAVQRTKLLGSAVDPGLAEAVFQAEAEWDTPVVKRLLEYSLEGEFEIQTEGQRRTVPLRGKADRIDLLEDNSFRIIDYKLGRAPERKLSLQLPIYSVCAAQHLRQSTGKDWEPGQAGYIAFAQDREFMPMLGRGMTRDQVLRDAQERLLAAIEKIERGEFPPTPADTMMCTRCSHAAICRKDYVGDV
jgi:RecB family exonuclease